MPQGRPAFLNHGDASFDGPPKLSQIIGDVLPDLID